MFRNIYVFCTVALLFAVLEMATASLFNSSVCVDPPGFDSCWNAATADAVSLFENHCTNGTCTDVDDCFSPDETCAKVATCVAYTEWISCALNHCWNRVSVPILYTDKPDRSRCTIASINTLPSEPCETVQLPISCLLISHHLPGLQELVLVE